MSSVRFENIYLLYLIIPLVAIMLVGYFLIPKSRRKRLKNIISLALHMLISVTLCFSFANLEYLENTSNIELMVVVDCSYSEDQSIDKINTLVKDIYDEIDKKTTKVKVICFAENQVLFTNDNEEFNGFNADFSDSKFSNFNRESSDLASALLYANSLYSDSAVRRMIVISDGEETDNSAMNVISDLIENDVHLDTVLLNENIGDEVALVNLTYTDQCFINKDQKLELLIRSKKEAEVEIEILKNGVTFKRETKTVNRGYNTISYDLDSSKVGTYDYEVKISSQNDYFEQNNEMDFTQEFTDKYNILFIGKSNAEYEKFIKFNSFFNPQLSGNTNVDKYVDTNYFPHSFVDLCGYDEIILSDINFLEVDNASDFINNLHTLVENYGKSVYTFGGTYSDSIKNDYIATYSDMLPIQTKSDEGKAVVLLIDISSSMSMNNKFTYAKKAAIKALNNLNEEDYVAVLAFSGNTKVITPLTSVKNKLEIINAINKLELEDATSMSGAMGACYNQLSNSKSDSKTVITITDGLPAETQNELINEVKTYTKSSDIVFSFVDVNSDSTSSAFLKNLAIVGNGNYYHCTDASDLIDLMKEEVIGDLGNVLIKQTSNVYKREEDDETLKDIDGSFSSISEFYFARTKSAATTVLTTQYSKNGESSQSTISVPLFAYWDYGKGRVSSFNAPLNSDATETFLSDTYGSKFISNTLDESIPKRRNTSMLDFSYENNGITSKINIATHNKDKTGIVTFSITNPNKENTDYEGVFDGSYYGATINSGIKGKYDVHVKYVSGIDGEIVEDDFEFYFDYSKEFDVFTNDENELLYKLSKSTSGNYSIGEINYEFLDEEIAYSSYKSTSLIFLGVSVGLFVLDIFVRKSDLIIKKKGAKNESKAIK